MIDASDKTVAQAFEGTNKDANINGIPSFTASVMTSAEYTPSAVPATLPRDFNRDLGASMANALRSFPLRVPMYAAAALPTPSDWAGAVVYVSDSGGPMLAFSDGSNWLRAHDLTTI